MHFSFTQEQLTKSATAKHEAEIFRLYRAIMSGAGQFRFLFGQFNREFYREARMINLSVHIPHMHDVKVTDEDFANFYELQQHLTALAPKYAALHVLGLEQWLDGDAAEWMQGFNYRREELRRTCPTPLILWLSEASLNRFVVEAADAWAWRGGVFDFVLPLADIPRVSVEDLEYAETEGQRKRRRIQALEKYFAEQGKTIAPELYANLLEEKGKLHENLSEYPAARHCYSRAYQKYFQVGNLPAAVGSVVHIAYIDYLEGKLDEAYTKLTRQVLPLVAGQPSLMAAAQEYIAEILQARGEFDEALRILQEVAPILENLGEERNWAVTMGKIANILSHQGKTDEALHILQQDTLPVFEKLGQLHEKAVTLNEIAKILESRGELDEALRIYQQETLPIYERLGNMYGEAMVLTDIADVLTKRGELTDALQHYQHALTILERLGTLVDITITRKNLARLLMQLDPAQPEEAKRLLCLALADARHMRIPEAEDIEELLTKYEMTCEGVEP